jgi:hypothetical protein
VVVESDGEGHAHLVLSLCAVAIEEERKRRDEGVRWSWAGPRRKGRKERGGPDRLGRREEGRWADEEELGRRVRGKTERGLIEG